MGMYFGTDGIRGKYGTDITPSLAFKCGCSLSNLCKIKKVLIGRDTRVSGDVLALSVANGLMSHGVSVIDVGITPTPVISFLTTLLKCDFGVVISASHNPPEHNGIKIFDKNGYKISEKDEEKIESFFSFSEYCTFDKLGKYQFKPNYINKYKDFVLKNSLKLDGLKIVIDCGYGATFKLAKEIFSSLNANITFLNCKNKGLKINENCGALYPEYIANEVIKQKADIGFSFDGDGDRIIACDEKGNIIDGDDILYILSKNLDKKEKFIVGTSMTNKGLEDILEKNKINLLRADVGDKYVAEIMKSKNALLGGEPSGHIIIRNFSKTGDAIWAACTLSMIAKKLNKPISKIIDYKKYPQINKNIVVNDKFRILNSKVLSQTIIDIQKIFKNKGRILVRASGTENKIRIMCEHISKKTALETALKLEKIVLQANKSY